LPGVLDDGLTSEAELIAAALALGADDVDPLTPAELSLVRRSPVIPAFQVRRLEELIWSGADPLGEAFCRIRNTQQRRSLGATYTPAPIVAAMVEWASKHSAPDRVIDPGAGSARFAVAAGRVFPKAHLLAIEVDPVAALCARAHLAAAGLADRAQVVLMDFRALPPLKDGRTLWLGNPPYVRHHQIAPEWKDWLAREASHLGLHASKLAGLHVHFFLATAVQARAGDAGCFITSAEWLDVNYGSLVRELLLDVLGGQAVHMITPEAMPFADAATTGAITCFLVGSKPSSVRLRRVENVATLGCLQGGRHVRRERLIEAPRWTVLMRSSKPIPQGHLELGELCRVHRGAVTGANRVWIAGDQHPQLPASVLRPSVTKARELFAAGSSIASAEELRRVIDLPEDLDDLEPSSIRAVRSFLRWAKAHGAHEGYIAQHRRSWWAVGLRSPAPILATYMARRPPTFVRNLAEARHINIAHGLYPRQSLSDQVLDRLAAALRTTVTQSQGRTYAGGLIKFEPREMERILVPALDQLTS
jgi:hypothetical protein